MQSAMAAKIEKRVEQSASTLFAAACGYAAYAWLLAYAREPVLGAESGGAAALAYIFSARLLNAIEPRPQRLPVPIFDLRQIDDPEWPELLLTDPYRPGAPTAAGTLAIDDIRAELAPDSRVVRLFDPAAMPTPGELNQRIERHLLDDVRPATSPDATQALHQALAELRRSMG